MNRKPLNTVVALMLVLIGFGALSVSAAPVKLSEPLPIYVVATDGQRVVGEILGFDEQGFELKDAAGAVQKVAWEKLSAKSVYQLHEKLLKPSDKAGWASLTERLTKMKDGEEWAEKANKKAGGQASSPSAPQPAPKSDTPPAADPIAPGQWTDLLALADPDLDGVEGDWTRQDKTLLAPGVGFGRLALPAMPEGNYEYEVEFERIGGNDAVAVMIAVGKTQLAVNVGWSNGGKNSLEFVDGKTVFSEKTGQVANNKRYALSVRVKLDGDSADIDTKLNGQPLIHWSGPTKSLKTHNDWKLPSLDAVGFGAQRSKVLFHSARIRMLSGELKTVSHESRLAKASIPKLPKEAGQFVTSLAVDKQNCLWVGTEGKGLWRYDPSQPLRDRWKQFTRVSTGGDDESYGPSMTYGTKNQNALGDDFAYALAVDDLGRLWMGHLNHGVSVFNGKEWRNYDRITGPLGERIFDIEVAPPLEGQKYGDIWMASSLGLARYSPTTKKWSYRTRAEGLPEDQVQALAFDKQGRMYAGTQCHGIAIADPADDYTSWRRVTGPDPFSNKPAGEGIPTDLINDVLVSKDGTIYMATSHGLAKSGDLGETWNYIRGRDWEEMVKGLYKGPKPEGKADPDGLLAEDYITSLSEDAKGNLWIGYRQKGYEAYEAGTGKRLHRAEVKSGKFYTFKVLAAEGYPPLLGGYGEGLRDVDVAAEEAGQPPRGANAGVGEIPPLPKDAEPPTVAELEEMKKRLESLKEPMSNPGGAFLGEDWMTQGDWLGRIGKYWASIAAILGSQDYIWGAGEERVPFYGYIGPNHKKGDEIRRWIWELYSSDRRGLEMPPTYYHSRVHHGLTKESNKVRRPAGWDDHAEDYPMHHEGPHMYFKIEVPDGDFVLSFYFLNYDGHQGMNRFRDYLLKLYHAPPSRSVSEQQYLDHLPPVATSRIRDFWSGAYKRFHVRGPMTILAKVDRNHSFNTMLSGVFLDQIAAWPQPYMQPSRVAPLVFANNPRASQLIRKLEMNSNNPAWAIHHQRGYTYAYRSLLNSPDKSESRKWAMATCAYHIGDYGKWEQLLGSLKLTPPRQVEKTLKWDMKSHTMSGRGYETVRAYLTESHSKTP